MFTQPPEHLARSPRGRCATVRGICALSARCAGEVARDGGSWQALARGDDPSRRRDALVRSGLRPAAAAAVRMV